MRDEQMSYRGSVVLGCVGLLMGITAACSGGSPASPSTTTGGSSQLLGSFGVSSSPMRWLEKSKSTRLRRVRRYCERLPTGHKRYERCQAWLKSRDPQ